MKKFLALLLATIMILSLAACGQQAAPAADEKPAAADETAPAAPEKVDTPLVVGYSVQPEILPVLF